MFVIEEMDFWTLAMFGLSGCQQSVACWTHRTVWWKYLWSRGSLIKVLYQEMHRFHGTSCTILWLKPNSTPHHNMCLIDLTIWWQQQPSRDQTDIIQNLSSSEHKLKSVARLLVVLDSVDLLVLNLQTLCCRKRNIKIKPKQLLQNASYRQSCYLANECSKRKRFLSLARRKSPVHSFPQLWEWEKSPNQNTVTAWNRREVEPLVIWYQAPFPTDPAVAVSGCEVWDHPTPGKR